MSDRIEYTDWCDSIKGAGKDARFRIILGSRFIDEHMGTDPNEEIRKACIGKSILQIFVPEEMLDVCGEISENGLKSSCLDGIIFAFEDCIVDFNFGGYSIADRSVEVFAEVPADTGAYSCYCPIEHFIGLDYKGQTVTDCGFETLDKSDWDMSDMFGKQIFVSLSGGKTFYLSSGECVTHIMLE